MALAQDKTNAVIPDAMMQGAMDGFQLCERIKRSPDPQDIHVIVVTARAQERDIAQGWP